MPKLKLYKATKETNPCGDDMVTVEEFDAFKSKLTEYAAWRDQPGVYGWSPEFPCAPYGYFGTIPEEALYRSNYECVKEVFEETLELELESGSSDTFELPLDNTHAIALACKIERDMDGYPVMDEEHYSNLEQELIKEAYESYGRDDFLEVITEYDAIAELLDEEGEVLEEYAEYLESYGHRIAGYAVGYSGEMYFNDDSLRDALSDICYVHEETPRRVGLEELLDRFVKLIKEDKFDDDRRKEEEVQLTIEEIYMMAAKKIIKKRRNGSSRFKNTKTGIPFKTGR